MTANEQNILDVIAEALGRSLYQHGEKHANNEGDGIKEAVRTIGVHLEMHPEVLPEFDRNNFVGMVRAAFCNEKEKRAHRIIEGL